MPTAVGFLAQQFRNETANVADHRIRFLSKESFIAAVAIVGEIVVADFQPGCEQETAEIKIGVAGAHSGDLAPYGIPTVNAVELYIEKINEAGGIDGKQVVLVIEDDQCAPEVATNTATKPG